MEKLMQNELLLYSRLTKPLILNLPDWEDRVRAASWVKKIRDESAGTESLRIIYLKLLLFTLQRGHLVGIFDSDPKVGELEPLTEGFDINDLAKNAIELELAERQDRIKRQLRGQAETSPPYLTDCSSDFREYVAVQNIPGFGIHSYYAISKEPVNMWNQLERGIFPKLARSAVDNSRPIPENKIPADGGCPCDPNAPECLCKKKAKTEKSQPKPKKKQYGNRPPITPIGVRPHPDDRKSPTWGSNLLHVKEKPKFVESDDDLRRVCAEGFELTDVLSGIEQFIDEYSEDKFAKVSKIKGMRVVIPETSSDNEVKRGAEKEDKDKGEDEDEDEDEDEGVRARKEREKEINDDAHIVSYYRDLFSQTAMRKAIAQANANVIASSPARVGIPLSTPTLSPSPRRLISSERLYEEEIVRIVPEEKPEGKPDAEDAVETVSPTNDNLTNWTKRLKAVQKICEVNLTQLDASQQVDKTVVLSKKGIPKKDEACGPTNPCQ